MLTLPKGLTVKRNRANEAKLLDKARAWLEKDERTDGIHASGLLDPRQSYWGIKKPQEISDRLVNIFLVGKILHVLILGQGGSDEGSFFNKKLGIWYSPDSIRNGKVREIKTTRSFYAPKDYKDLDMYLEQVLIYMAAANVLEADLDVLYINLRDEETKRTSPEYRCFKVTITEGDLARVTKEIITTRKSIEAALESNKKEPWRELPLCREWKCSAGGCNWYHDCQPEGRYGEKKFDRG